MYDPKPGGVSVTLDLKVKPDKNGVNTHNQVCIHDPQILVEQRTTQAGRIADEEQSGRNRTDSASDF